MSPPAIEDTVLIGMWPDPRDRGRAFDQHWYRVRPGRRVNFLGRLDRFRTLA